VAGATTLAAVALLPLTGSEVMVYKAGLIVVFLVAAMGMHLLVNWAGQLSLAHAAMIGLPAFVAVRLSESHGISPLYLLPVATTVGAAVGAVVGLPTLRAQGVQVALVTLAAGIAVDRFFFTKEWLVGSVGGRTAAAPRLGPFTLSTSRSLYLVVLAVAAVAAAALWMLLHSRVGRAWFWVRDEPQAASAFGIPVPGYRLAAYVASGCFAGLAGGLTVAWVGQLTPAAFPATLSLTHLVVAVVAGTGYLGGLAFAALMLEGGRLFAASADALVVYGGPLALVFTITRYQSGVNGAGRSIMERLRRFAAARTGDVEPEPITFGLIAAAAAVTAGFLAVGLAWYHAGNTDQTWVQNQELISGGLGGLGLVLLGVGLLIRDRIATGQRMLARQLADALGQPRREPSALPAPSPNGVAGPVSVLVAEAADQ
jgi:branched-chain amino acid transport system permease protein